MSMLPAPGKLIPALLLLFVAAPTARPAGSEKTDTRPVAIPVVWMLDNTSLVGGQKPEVLGAPKVVVGPEGKALYFDGKKDGLLIAKNPIAGWQRFTIEVLIKPDPTGDEEQRFIHIQDAQGRRAMIETRVTRDGFWVLDTYLRDTQEQNRTLIDRSKRHPAGHWYWVSLVYDGEVMTNYINGVKEIEGEVLVPPMLDGAISIGVRQNKIYWYKGLIAEIRFVREALPVEKLQRVAGVPRPGD